MGKQSLVAKIQAYGDAARAEGFACWHPEVGFNEVRGYVGRHGTDSMTAEAAAAYNALSPAVFWVAFQRGWDDAAARALG